MIGVDNWSIELQKSEFYSLYLLLLRINEQLLVIEDELMDEEFINLEIEQLPWYAELEGKKYCLLYTSPSPRDSFRSRMPSSA